MPNETMLVRTLVELADNLVDDFDAIDLLTRLSDRCVEVLDVTAAGVMLANPGGQLQVVASSSHTMRLLELFELEANQGPCLDCYQTGQPVINLELAAADRRWPRFATRALAAGFHSVHSLPMHLRDRTIGALNMFRTDTGALTDDDVAAGQALADIATIAIIQHRTTVDAQTLNAQLNHALQSRIVIEQAKGKISEAAGIDIDQAFQRLRNHSRNHNIRLTDLAQHLADGTITPRSLDLARPSPPQTAAGIRKIDGGSSVR